ncbi:MAG: hypothetical protein QXX81_05665 [Zestosphaera sp.]
MSKLFIMGASGKLMRHIALALVDLHQLILQCNKGCEELARFLLETCGRSEGKGVSLVKHDFIVEGVESLGDKIGNLTNALDAVILGLPVFNQTGFQNLSEDTVRRVIYLNVVVPLTLLKVLSSFMRGRDSLILLLTDLTPIRGSTIYEGLTPSLPTIVSSAAVHALIRESRNYIPDNIKVIGIALDWVRVPSKRMPESGFRNAVDLETVTAFVRKIIAERPQELSGKIVELSNRF